MTFLGPKRWSKYRGCHVLCYKSEITCAIIQVVMMKHNIQSYYWIFVKITIYTKASGEYINVVIW